MSGASSSAILDAETEERQNMDTRTAIPEGRSYRKTGVVFFAAGCIMLALSYVIGITDNPPGIVLMLAGLFAVGLGIIYGLARSGRRSPGQQLLYWSPRALCIVFALFISIFAMDVFQEGQGIWRTMVALFMHLIPTFLLLALLAVSWRREWIAGTLLPLLGVLYVVWAWGRPFASLSTLLLMAGPLVLTGALFLLNWSYRERLRG
jgi:hypothetical protein